MSSINFSSKLWRYSINQGSWFFITLPHVDAEFIRWIEDKTVIGFGFVRVRATIGNTTWETSIFPTKEKEYLLAIKASVRKKENLHENTEVSVIIELI